MSGLCPNSANYWNIVSKDSYDMGVENDTKISNNTVIDVVAIILYL